MHTTRRRLRSATRRREESELRLERRQRQWHDRGPRTRNDHDLPNGGMIRAWRTADDQGLANGRMIAVWAQRNVHGPRIDGGDHGARIDWVFMARGSTG
jgi:hypothetical protein